MMKIINFILGFPHLHVGNGMFGHIGNKITNGSRKLIDLIKNLSKDVSPGENLPHFHDYLCLLVFTSLFYKTPTCMLLPSLEW